MDFLIRGHHFFFFLLAGFVRNTWSIIVNIDQGKWCVCRGYCKYFQGNYIVIWLTNYIDIWPTNYFIMIYDQWIILYDQRIIKYWYMTNELRDHNISYGLWVMRLSRWNELLQSMMVALIMMLPPREKFLLSTLISTGSRGNEYHYHNHH